MLLCIVAVRVCFGCASVRPVQFRCVALRLLCVCCLWCVVFIMCLVCVVVLFGFVCLVVVYCVGRDVVCWCVVCGCVLWAYCDVWLCCGVGLRYVLFVV